MRSASRAARPAARGLDQHLPQPRAAAPAAVGAAGSADRSNFTIYDQADQLRLVKDVPGGARARPEALRPARDRRAISKAKNQLLGPEEYRAAGRRTSTARRSPRSTQLYEKRLSRLERGRLRRPALLHRRTCWSTTRNCAPKLADARFRYVLIDEYQDTNHAQYAIAPAARRATTRTSASSATRTSRSTSGAGREHPQHPRLRARLPGRATIALEQNYRSTNSILEAATHVIAQQPRAQAEEPLVGARRGRAGARDRGRGRARRGALRRGADRAARRPGARRERDRGLLPDERPVAGAGGRARSPADPVPVSAARGSTSGRRSRTCSRTSG